MSQKDDDPLCNPGHQPHFHNVVSINHKRRGLLRGSFCAATLACFGLPVLGRPGAAFAADSAKATMARQ